MKAVTAVSCAIEIINKDLLETSSSSSELENFVENRLIRNPAPLSDFREILLLLISSSGSMESSNAAIFTSSSWNSTYFLFEPLVRLLSTEAVSRFKIVLYRCWHWFHIPYFYLSQIIITDDFFTELEK